jgi:hypothetical protein
MHLAAATRVTTFLYDWRDRRTDTDGKVDFYEKVCYDNLDRVIQTDRYNTDLSGSLVARSQTHYDDGGRVYQTIRYGVDPDTGSVGYGLVDNIWFDAAGNVLKSLPAESQFFTKSVFDGVGRVITQYSGYNATDSSYANASFSFAGRHMGSCGGIFISSAAKSAEQGWARQPTSRQ